MAFEASTEPGRRVIRAVVVAGIVLGLLSACTSEGGSGEASCARQFDFDGRTYTEMSTEKSRSGAFEAGDSLGDSALKQCDDVGAEDPEPRRLPGELTVFRAVGLDPKLVLMAGTSRKDALLYGVLDGTGTLSNEAAELAEGAKPSSGTSESGTARPFKISAHCGVGVVYIDDEPWRTEFRDDGHGNAPKGWPQIVDGELRMVDATTAIFSSDDISEQLVFHPDPGATWKCD